MVAPGVRDRNYSREVFDAQRREKSAQGKPGAKARPKGVVDAHTVEIP